MLFYVFQACDDVPWTNVLVVHYSTIDYVTY